MIRPDTFWFTALLGALTAMTALAIDMSLPALPTLSAAFGAAPDRAQLTLSLFVLGYAGGQLFYGPLSDRYGRRPLLLVGLAVYTLAGLACALSSSIAMLVAARLVQGLGGCVGPILGRAVVRDHYSGARAAQALSYITLVFAVAPLVAPIIGGFLLAHFGWRSVFLAFAGFGLVLGVASWFGFGESLTRPDPEALRLARMLGNARAFFRSRLCVGYALINGFTFAGLFAFISGSPFVLIESYHVPPQRFGLYFALAASSVMIGAIVNSRLLRRRQPERVLRLGLHLLVLAGMAALLLALSGRGGPFGFLLPAMLYIFAQGITMPNAIAAAMEPLRGMAGMGASLLGALQMIGGSLSGYAVNALYDGTPVPVAALLALMAVGAFLSHRMILPKISHASELTTL